MLFTTCNAPSLCDNSLKVEGANALYINCSTKQKKKKTGRYYRQHEKYFLFKYNFADKTEDEDEDHHLAAGHMPNKK